jgi:DNA-binding Xre family transcriptional regulator
LLVLFFSKYVNTFALNLNKITMDELNRLKVVLVEQKKTGKWLAEQLGVSTTTTSRWCSNASQPDLQTLNKIAKVLNVNMKDLLADSKIE